MSPAPCIGIVDDDPAARRALRRLLTAEGCTVQMWATAEELLTDPGTPPDCLVLDVDLPGTSGLDLQRQLTDRGQQTPVIFLTGQGDIPMTVRAMKGGAVNFLTKPVQAAELLTAVRAALEIARERRLSTEQTASARRRYESLTPREQEVMAHLITGKLNKQIAADLGTSEQTIKVHRMRLLSKMEVHSVAELVRLADSLNVTPAARH